MLSTKYPRTKKKLIKLMKGTRGLKKAGLIGEKGQYGCCEHAMGKALSSNGKELETLFWKVDDGTSYPYWWADKPKEKVLVGVILHGRLFITEIDAIVVNKAKTEVLITDEQLQTYLI